MTRLTDIEEYLNEIKTYSKCNIDWDLLKDKSFLISGSTGMIGKCLIDLIMYKNHSDNLNCNIIALGRDAGKAHDRLGEYFGDENFSFIEGDITKDANIPCSKIDYILHAASSTHPLLYSTYPIETITANVMGTYNLLELSAKVHAKRFLFASSVEIYGENNGTTDRFGERDFGYIDCNTLRAGYPESKRTGEALCQAYIKQKGVDAVIARISRVFGPTMLMNDTKASSQFIKNGINGENIVLKSNGLQYYSYSYVFDAVIGLLICLTKGKCGEAYNICDEKFDITLGDFAKACASFSDRKVVFDLPTEQEKAGYSTATKAALDSAKINELGYGASGTINEKINQTILILRKSNE
jgi:nucleoside-diphosphate-sugar epimerase